MISYPSRSLEDLINSSQAELLNSIKERDKIINELKESISKLEIQFLTLKNETKGKELETMDYKDQTIQKWILKYINLTNQAEIDSVSYKQQIESNQHQINALKRENQSLRKFVNISDIKPIERSAIKMLHMINNSLEIFLNNLTPSTKRTLKNQNRNRQLYSSYENMIINHERAFSADVPTEVRKIRINKNEEHDTDIEILDFSGLNEVNQTNFSTTKQIKNKKLFEKQNSLKELIRRIYKSKNGAHFKNQSPYSPIERNYYEPQNSKITDFQIQGFLHKMKNEIQRFLIRNNIFNTKKIKSRNIISQDEINDVDDSKTFQFLMETQKIKPSFRALPTSKIRLKEQANFLDRDSLNITDKELLTHALINSGKSNEKVSRIDVKLEDLLAVNSNYSKSSILLRNFTPNRQMKFNSTIKNSSQIRPNTDSIHKKRNLIKPASIAELGKYSLSYKKEVPHISLNLLDKYFIEGKKGNLRSTKKDESLNNTGQKKDKSYLRANNSELILSWSKPNLREEIKKSEFKLLTIKSPTLSPIIGNDQILFSSGIQEIEEHNSISNQNNNSNNKKSDLSENKIELLDHIDKKSFELSIPENKESNETELKKLSLNSTIERQHSFPIKNSILKCAFSYCLPKKHH